MIERTYNRADKFLKECESSIFDFQHRDDLATKEKSRTKIWYENEQKFVNDIGLLKDELRRTFRTILGGKEGNNESK